MTEETESHRVALELMGAVRDLIGGARLIVSEKSPPVAGEVLVVEVFRHLGGETRALARGKTVWMDFDSLKEAFPERCPSCVGTVRLIRVESDGKAKDVFSTTMPKHREDMRYMCDQCRDREAEKAARVFEERLSALEVEHVRKGGPPGYSMEWKRKI